MRTVIFYLLMGMTLSFIAGCGGNTKPSLTTISDRGSVTFSVKWPDIGITANTRNIPNGTTKIIVTVIQNSQVINAVTILRPNSSGTINAIPVGNATVEAKAYNDSNFITANGSTTVTVVKNTAVTARLTLTGTGWCINPTDGSEMVWVPGATFTMGAEYNLLGPGTQQVTLSGYWVYKYEVTVEQYRSFCSATGHALPTFPSGYSWRNYTNWDDSGLQKHPIVNISWTDAKAYSDWAGSMLATEAQWEYAARGPSENNFPWGGIATVDNPYNGWEIQYTPNTLCANTWNSKDRNISTWSVGSFPSGLSWCGAHDMAGNASEWCADWYGAYSVTPDSNPTGPQSGVQRVFRGGSWSDGILYKYHEAIPRSVDRFMSNPSDVSTSIGFRCVSNTPGP